MVKQYQPPKNWIVPDPKNHQQKRPSMAWPDRDSEGFGAVAGQARHACGRCAKGMSRYHPCACGNHQWRNWGDRDTCKKWVSFKTWAMGNSESEVGPMFACQVGRFCSGHTNNVWYYELMSTHATFGKGTKFEDEYVKPVPAFRFKVQPQCGLRSP